MLPILSLIVATATAAAEAQAVAAPAPAPVVEVAPWYRPFGLALALETSTGIGTFVASDKADNPLWTSTLTLNPTWAFDEHLHVGAGLSLTYDWTYLVTPCHPASGPRPAGAPKQDCSDTDDPNGRRGDVSDLELSVSHDALFTLFDMVTVGAVGGIKLPTSRASRAARNVLTLGASASGSSQVGAFKPSVGLGFNKHFPTANAATLDAAEVENSGVPIGHCPSFRQTDCILLAGFVASWQLTANAGVEVEIPWVEGLSGSVSFVYTYSRAHGRDPDAFTSPRTDASGARVATGVNEADTTGGTIELAYAPDDSWSFAFGVTSSQPARTADGKSLRFPFFDFISPANNYTGWYLTIGYAL